MTWPWISSRISALLTSKPHRAHLMSNTSGPLATAPTPPALTRGAAMFKVLLRMVPGAEAYAHTLNVIGIPQLRPTPCRLPGEQTHDSPAGVIGSSLFGLSLCIRKVDVHQNFHSLRRRVVDARPGRPILRRKMKTQVQQDTSMA